MKIKSFKEKYEVQVKKPIKGRKIIDKKWTIIVIILAFLISCILSCVSELLIPNVHLALSLLLILVFIILNVVFDIIGAAITMAEPKMFHSMATKKVKGAKTAIKFINKKDKVSNFCSDVIGDICGVISGSCGLSVAIKVSNIFNYKLLIVTVLVTSLISAITIGGKALGKSYAVNRCNEIIFNVSKILSVFDDRKKN